MKKSVSLYSANKEATHCYDLRFFLPFSIFSLGVVALGCFVAARSGLAESLLIRNLVAWCAGCIAAGLIVRMFSDRLLQVVLIAAAAGVASTFLHHGQQGVHRWLAVGPLQVNVAEVVLPPACVAIAVLIGHRIASLSMFALAVLLLMQPDASQATAFCGAMIAVLILSEVSRLVRFGSVSLLLLIVALTWMRLDPLQPVPAVEGIVTLAFVVSPLALLAAVTLLGITCISPMWIPTTNATSVALGTYFLLSALTPLLGAFPVPLLGMSMSPIFGFWLGAGALMGCARISGRLLKS